MSNPVVDGTNGSTLSTASPESMRMPIVRIAVFGSGRITEVALPADLPLREIIPAVERLVSPNDDTTDTIVAWDCGAPQSVIGPKNLQKLFVIFPQVYNCEI